MTLWIPTNTKSTKERLPEAEVILITGYGTVRDCVDAVQKGAATYLLKPININHLRAEVNKLVEKQYLIRSNKELHKQLDERFGCPALVAIARRCKKY